MQLEALLCEKDCSEKSPGTTPGWEAAKGSFLLWLLYKGFIKSFVGFVVLMLLGTLFAPYQDKENNWSNVTREAL